MTDELLIGYLDAAQDRLSQRAESRFTASLEAARMGVIFGQDQTQYDRWRRRSGTRGPSMAKTGAALEQHVANLRRERPDLVRMSA